MHTKKTNRGRPRLVAPDIGRVDHNASSSIEKQIYRLLANAMMAGVFVPGTSFTGRSLADSLDVSPTPVRDALKRLEADGVVESRNKSAFYLPELYREQYQEILNLRLLIEGYAASQAAKAVSDQDIERLEGINRAYEGCGDVKQSVNINFQFHFDIYRLTQSPILMETIEKLWVRIGPSMHLHAQNYELDEVAANHAKLIDALRQRDSPKAARALRWDLKRAARAIMPRLVPRASSAQLDGHSLGNFKAADS